MCHMTLLLPVLSCHCHVIKLDNRSFSRVNIFEDFHFVYHFIHTCVLFPWFTDSIRIMIRKMESLQQGHCEVCVAVLQEKHVIQWISNSIHWYHGVFHIQATGTTTGQGFMEDLSGMDSSALQSPILSLWENR